MNELLKIASVALVASLLGGFVSGLVGGNQSDQISFGGISHTNSGYVINEDGTDDDTRIEGDSDANLLSIDAGNDTVAIGTNGTGMGRVNTGTCYYAPYSGAVAASSTAVVDCQATATWDASGIAALTGVSSGDTVSVTAATTSAPQTFLGLDVIGATASSTDGYIQLHIRNLTGASYAWDTISTASGTASYTSIQPN